MLETQHVRCHWREQKVSSRLSLSLAPRAGGVRQAACILDGIGGRVELVSTLSVAAAGGHSQVSTTTAQKAVCPLVEKVTSEEHVDPGVTATVQTGQ